jgi:hypothetical protein
VNYHVIEVPDIDIRDMTMAEYAALRKRVGLVPDETSRGIFPLYGSSGWTVQTEVNLTSADKWTKAKDMYIDTGDVKYLEEMQRYVTEDDDDTYDKDGKPEPRPRNKWRLASWWHR